MNARIPKNVVAMTPGGAITTDMLLGFYALFTVPDRPIPANKLARTWAAEGLPMELVPKKRNATDTFKNACRSVETRRQDSHRTTEIKVDGVSEDQYSCVYQITRMVRDKAHAVIDHPKAIRVTFNKAHVAGDAVIDFDRLEEPNGHTDELADIEKSISDFFDENGSKVPGAKVRAAIRGVMENASATLIRKGVYFTPKNAKDDLDSIGHVLTNLYGDDSLTHLIPCANADGEKAIIEKYMTAQVSSEVDDMMAELYKRLNEGGRVRKDRFGNLMAKRAELAKYRQSYRDLLGDNLDTLDSKFDLMDGQLDKLTEMIGERADA